MTGHTPGSHFCDHNEPREMKLEQDIENDVRDLIKNPTNNASHKDSQELKDGYTEIKANSAPFDGRTLTPSRKELLYELVTGGPFHGMTPSALDFIYTTLEDKDMSQDSGLSEKLGKALSALEEEIFKEDKKATLEKFPEFPLEVQRIVWNYALLEPKVVRIGILPTERTIGE